MKTARPHPLPGFALAVACALFLQSPTVFGRTNFIKPGAPYPNSALPWPPRTAVYDQPPRLISGNAPIYPIKQLYAHESGYAVVAFIVGADGATHDIRIVRTTYPYFASHTVTAVRAWKFEPARKKGKPVPVPIQLIMPFGFR